MGMSTQVVAFRDMDGEFAKMLEVKRFCEAHHVSYPAEVDAFFKGKADYSEDVLREEFLEIPLGDALSKWEDDDADGYEVDVSKIPVGVKTIRFSNSW